MSPETNSRLLPTLTMVECLTAVRFYRFATSGRNKPGMYGCVDANGDPAGDYVV